MAETNATILIPDISGFTEFMTSTELTHASHAINFLIESMLNAVGDEYEVSEIEGDAVLLIKKGPAPSRKEILDICIKIFNAFHFQRKWMQQHTICPCGACQAVINLTLKFVAHHGPLAEIKIGRFVKQSGPEMIVAHRLLKNSIQNHEYLLMTEKLLQEAQETPETIEMEWQSSSEEYASIGKVDFRFMLLNDARKKVPEPPAPPDYASDDSAYDELLIDISYVDAYELLINIPLRKEWVPGLESVKQEFPQAFVGSIHYCKFEDYEAVISPLRMTVSDEGIMYAESCRINEKDLSLTYEFIFRKLAENTCYLTTRFLNAAESPLTEDVSAHLTRNLQQMALKLKEFCEKRRES